MFAALTPAESWEMTSLSAKNGAGVGDRGGLAACGGHRGRAAEYLGISRRYLQYKIREYHISSRCRYDQGS